MTHTLTGSTTACGGDAVTVNVAVAPEIAPAINSIATQWLKTKPDVGGHCVRVVVSGQAPAATANEFLTGTGASINNGALPTTAPTTVPSTGTAVSGTGVQSAAASPSAAARPGSNAPAVWIPDSTAWLGRVQADSSDAFTQNTPSVASSPVVIAVEHSEAAKVGMGSGAIALATLKKDVATMRSEFGTTDTPGPFQLGLADPRNDSAGLAGALMLAAMESDDTTYATLVADYRVASPVSQLALDSPSLIKAFAAPNKDGEAQMSVGILSEQAILAFDATNPPQPLDAIRLDQQLFALDYPVAVSAGAAGNVAEAAALFQSAVTQPAYRPLFAAAGFRAPDGTTAAGFPAGHGASTAPTQIHPMAIDQTAQTILAVWGAANTASRVLVLVNVAASMGTPTAGDSLSPLKITQEAGLAGLGMFTPDSQLGMWAFGPGLGPKDYHEVVPIAPLTANGGAQATSMENALGGAQVVASSQGCGLYPAVDAAYRNVLANYAPGRINTVVVFTNCAASDPGSMSLTGLTSDLETLADVNRPIPLVLIYAGTKTAYAKAEPNLKTIAGSVGGTPYNLTSPDGILSIFLHALVEVGGS